MYQQMAVILDKYSDADGMHPTAIPGVNYLKATEAGHRTPSVFQPSLCIIVQGKKRVLLGEEVLTYAPSQYLVASVDLPVIGEVTHASRAMPYLTLQIDLQPALLSELLAMVPEHHEMQRGLFVGRVSDAQAAASLRLLQLLDAPDDIAVMAPLLIREVHYRLLQSPEGRAIAQLAVRGSQLQRIAQVIAQMKDVYAKPLPIEALAEKVSMSVSTFHAHFKAVTAMSPLQFQKRLRLMEARRLMLADGITAADAAYRVGYESSSQFSREYARYFGMPPARDVERLRAA